MIDVSNYQATIDWQSVKDAGVERAYVKLGEYSVIDPFAVANLHHARAVGVTVGLYYFAHPSIVARDEASNFLRLADGHTLAGDLVPMLDLEVMEGLTLAQLASWKAAWFNTVDAQLGTKAGFYSFRYMLNYMYAHLDPARPVWGSAPGAALTAQEEARWSYHQYSFTGRVPGITGNVDLDRVLSPTAPAPSDPRLP